MVAGPDSGGRHDVCWLRPSPILSYVERRGMLREGKFRTAAIDGTFVIRRHTVSNVCGGGCMNWWRDIRISVRTLTRHRAFTITAVSTFAIAIASTTAIATIV